MSSSAVRKYGVAATLMLALVAPIPASAQTVGSIVGASHPCDSTIPASWRLNDQLARAHSCMYPSDLAAVSAGSGLSFRAGSLRFASPQTRDALYAARRSSSFQVNAAYRTLLQQFYLQTSGACGSVARPGSSNHESGTAVDVQQYSAARAALVGAGCSWPAIENDLVHFNCLPRGVRPRTVLVFQRLWNLNNPGDRITEDNSWGPQSEARLRRASIGGFANDGCCDPSTEETCNGRDDDCDGTVDEGNACALQLLQEQPGVYAAPRTTDVNGDGRADLCARGAAGVRCWLAGDGGWTELASAVPWSDEAGWDDVSRHATLRMGDLDGDGRADLCGRGDTGVMCARSTGDGFEPETMWLDALSDAAGWDAPEHYATLRLADVNGDGRDDLCARGPEGFDCWLSDGERFATYVEGPRWSDAGGFDAPSRYGSIRMGDIDGDRRADVCALVEAGVECWRSDGAGFPERVAGPAWSDAGGWGAVSSWSTLRLVDYDGDGLDDLCGRGPDDLRCAPSLGSGFGEERSIAPLANASGWSDPSNYATLRVGDVDGDGAQDLCLRANIGVACYLVHGETIDVVTGPGWSDDSGWSAAAYYQTIRLADMDGDGLDDVCARAAAGWRCHPSNGEAFDDATLLDELRDVSNWNEPQYYGTILSATRPACRATAEVCDGRDDDCDGRADEGLDCETDSGMPDRDASVSADASSTGDAGGLSSTATGCGCRGGGNGSPLGSALTLFVLLGAWRRRRPLPARTARRDATDRRRE